MTVNGLEPKTSILMKTSFYKCHKCGNVMLRVSGGQVIPQCCNQTMELLTPGTTDGNLEYHVPVVSVLHNGIVKVTIGHKSHPMTPEHYIEFIFLKTEHGGMIAYLKPDEPPCAVFQTLDRPVAAYAYCNLHSLWKLCLEKCPSEKTD